MTQINRNAHYGISGRSQQNRRIHSARIAHDVEVFKQVLVRSALRKTIERVAVNDKRILGRVAAQTFIRRLQGAKLVAAQRYGKHLLASIDRGGWLTLHFGITGALSFLPKTGQEPPFTRVRLDFAGDGASRTPTKG